MAGGKLKLNTNGNSVSFPHSRDHSRAAQKPQQQLLLTCALSVSEWIASYEASIVDPKELKAEVDAYMQDYDKKMAEVRPG